jgi:hypothetical protein
MANITTTNRMSGKKLIETNGPIEFHTSEKGNIYFMCGEIVGYVSPKVREKVETVTADELSYAEVSIDGKEAIPTLMLRGPVVRTIE